MKKVVKMILAVLVVAGFVSGCGTSPAETTTTPTEAEETTVADQTEATETEAVETEEITEETEAQSDPSIPLVFDCESGTLAYTKHEVTKDYEGNPALIVYFDYTNKDETAANNAMFAFQVQGFQNGVAGGIAVITDAPAETSAAITNIKGGTTLPVAFALGLQDETSDVELEVSELISMGSDKATQILKLA